MVLMKYSKGLLRVQSLYLVEVIVVLWNKTHIFEIFVSVVRINGLSNFLNGDSNDGFRLGEEVSVYR
jgi:hypothetical protein